MDGTDQPTIRSVTAAEVRPIRREVLRIGMPEATVEFDGDDEPSTFHLACVDTGGSLLSVSTWMSRPFPGDGDRPSIQLRGMATRVHLQGSGLGALLLRAGIERSRELDVVSVWANARDSALDFYLAHDFRVVGDGFIEPVTSLPHHRVRFEI